VELGTAAAPVLVRWTTRGAAEDHAYAGRHAYALRTAAGVVLVDPDFVSPDAAGHLDALLRRMMDGRAPLAVLLTSSWHERAAYVFGRRLAVPVWLPAGGTAEMEGQPDHLFGEGTALPGGARATEIDPTFAGDTVLLLQALTGERVLFSGDAVLGGSGRPGHWREHPGAHVWLYGTPTVDLLRERFTPLLSLEIDLLYSAHGGPVPLRDAPIARLAALLERGQLAAGRSGAGLRLPLAPAPPPDLVTGVPRSPYETLGGIMFLPRAIDKMRAHLAGTKGEYNSHAGTSERLFRHVFGITAAQFEQIVRDNPTDDGVLAALQAITPLAQELIELSNEAAVNDGPITDGDWQEHWQRLEASGHGHRREIVTRYDRLDLDEGREVPVGGRRVEFWARRRAAIANRLRAARRYTC
jgi:hypothetical protein